MNQTATQSNILDQQLKDLDLKYRLYKNDQYSRVNSSETFHEVHRKLNLACQQLKAKKNQLIRTFHNYRAASLKGFETQQSQEYNKMIAEIHHTRMSLLKPSHLDHNLTNLSPKNNISYVARHVQEIMKSSPTASFPLWGWIIIGKTKLIDPANTIHKNLKNPIFFTAIIGVSLLCVVNFYWLYQKVIKRIKLEEAGNTLPLYCGKKRPYGAKEKKGG